MTMKEILRLTSSDGCQGPFTDRHTWNCRACGEEQTLSQPDHEPTDYCNRCAQLILPEAITAIEECVADIAADSELTRQTVWKNHLNALRRIIEFAKAGL